MSSLLAIKLTKPLQYFLAILLTFILVVAMIEVKTAYGKIPFQQHFLCYKQAYYKDNQTSGFFEKTYKVTGNTFMLNYTVYHPELQVHPLTIDFTLKQGSKNISTHQRTMHSPGQYEERFNLSELTTNSNILLQIQTSRCLTPINFGINLDNRRLGILLNSVSQDKRVLRGSPLT